MIPFSPDPAIAKRQLLAIIFYLTAFGHMDGEFAPAERRFVRDRVSKLVLARTRESLSGADPLTISVAAERWIGQFHKVAESIDREIAALFTESVAEGESPEQFVHAKLALRCFELLESFDDEGRDRLFDMVDELVRADGTIHPNEAKLRAEILGLLDAPPPPPPPSYEPEIVVEVDAPIYERALIVEPEITLTARVDDHPFLSWGERAYAASSYARLADEDLRLIHQVNGALEALRARGAGKLEGRHSVRELAHEEPFLDGHVYVVPPKPGKDYELIVLGDLHGCYACLKAAVLQTDFLARAQAYQEDPEHNPDVRLVLLGDYIDRGRFSFDGVLRAALRLMVAAPHAVHVLRGNHEYYIQHEGRVLAPVRPAEAMVSLAGVADHAFFAEWMRLFEALPNMLAFHRTLFVHAGIPRDEGLAERWRDLSSLNDADLRFQMLWSDPSEADVVPPELQRATARFAFGRQQCERFLHRIGCTSLIRGHERFVEGCKTIYDGDRATLISLFSSGGAQNADLPLDSNYREVRPMGLRIRHRDGLSRAAPFALDWQRWNEAGRNRFYGKG